MKTWLTKKDAEETEQIQTVRVEIQKKILAHQGGQIHVFKSVGEEEEEEEAKI